MNSFLAPIPKIHFDSAIDILKAKDFVLFGSDASEFFNNLETGIKCLIYLSHDQAEPVVLYEAVYQGLVRNAEEMHALEAQGFRPSTAVGEKWGFYWKISEVKKLPQPIELSSIKTKSGKYLKSFPRGPVAVI
ncbi:MAG: hypothetical protein IPK63_19920 [Candidatus Competibacteraceae bacterium]|nr:hypothetical protein [Candidatus Competibacteraceae bacterium]